MDGPTDVVQPSTVDINIRSSVKALFKQSCHAASEKGMLRWNLYKKVQTHPSCTVTLVKKLVKQLQKGIDKLQIFESPTRIIPILHTLYYVVLQSPALISPRLYQTMYACLMRLLVLPRPYSAVALNTLKHIKTEMFTPGSLFHRRVIAEQSLKNDHLKLQERVFLLADPELLSAPLEATVRADLEVCSSLRDPLILKRNMLLRLLQSGLGSYCHSPTLRQTLESLGDQCLEGFFQETVAAVEDGVKMGPEGWKIYIDDLKRIYANILTPSDENEDNTIYPVSLPYPEINFILWNDEEDLWNILTNFTLSSGPSFDADENEKSPRESMWSGDSGIDVTETDRPQSPLRNTNALKRRKAYKSTKSNNQLSLVNYKMDSSSTNSPSSREQRGHTARIVVMGDDRILGKLACAYRSIQEKESKHIMLTKKLNLQFYYIPITDAETSLSPQLDVPIQEDTRLSLASFLGKVDSWYDQNINSLQTIIPKLATMQMNHNRPSEQNLFFLDTLCYYLRCGEQKVNLPLYKVMMTRCSNEASSLTEEVFVSSLEADVAEFKHLKDRRAKSCNHRKKSVDVFGGVISVSYRQTFLSKREMYKGVCPMACGAVITSEPSAVHGDDYLGVRFNSVSPEETTKIFTKTISIKAMENRTLVVCLDKDLRRTYNDIQRIEVFPYIDPGCNIQSKFSMSMSKELPLSKFVDKVLSLPINTFSGVIS